MKKSISTISVLILAAFGILVCASPAVAASQPQVLRNAVAHTPTRFDVSPPLREMITPALPHIGIKKEGEEAPLRPKMQLLQSFGNLRPSAARPTVTSPAISATIGLSFEGVGNSTFLNCPSVAGIEVEPPDTNAAVGDTQVVEWVNLCYAIFDKSSGSLLAGPISGNNFWKGFGGVCEATNNGDVIIQWDKANHRWLASQLVYTAGSASCIAVSQTADATGSYFRYEFPQPGSIPDYPKWGLTPSVYYQTQNIFGSSFIGVNVCGYDATAMLAGSSKAKQVCILDNSNGTLFDDSMLPADSDSVAAGSIKKHSKPQAEVLLGSIDNTDPTSNVFEYVFTANFKKPAKSTLAGVNGTMPIPVPSFFLGCGGFTDCIKQPSPGENVEDLGDRLLYRLARFDDGTNQHYLVVHDVNNTTAVGEVVYEFRAPDATPTALSLYQSLTTPDDGEYRWFGSVAYDKAGDIAFGYSRSSSNSGDNPSLYYAGQTAGDPVGTNEAEALIHQGPYVQENSGAGRWGDYSSMALDVADGCTMWYAQEYYDTGSKGDGFAWSTWLASLKFPNCH